jgi:hypothetical protein
MTGADLRTARLSLKLTQREMAEHLHLTANSVPGTVIGYDWDEEFFGGGKVKPPKPVGF